MDFNIIVFNIGTHIDFLCKYTNIPEHRLHTSYTRDSITGKKKT